MHEPRSYIVPIYRQGFRTLLGFVEYTFSGDTRPLHSHRERQRATKETAYQQAGRKPKQRYGSEHSVVR